PRSERSLPRRAATELPRVAPVPPPRVIPVIAPAQAERRTAPRAAIRFNVRFGNAKGFVDQHAEDLSAGGMFLATAREIEPGATVLVVLALPDGGLPVEVPARVARVVRAGDPGGGKPGLGVQFVG